MKEILSQQIILKIKRVAQLKQQQFDDKKIATKISGLSDETMVFLEKAINTISPNNMLLIVNDLLLTHDEYFIKKLLKALNNVTDTNTISYMLLIAKKRKNEEFLIKIIEELARSNNETITIYIDRLLDCTNFDDQLTIEIIKILCRIKPENVQDDDHLDNILYLILDFLQLSHIDKKQMLKELEIMSKSINANAANYILLIFRNTLTITAQSDINYYLEIAKIISQCNYKNIMFIWHEIYFDDNYSKKEKIKYANMIQKCNSEEEMNQVAQTFLNETNCNNSTKYVSSDINIETLIHNLLQTDVGKTDEYNDKDIIKNSKII